MKLHQFSLILVQLLNTQNNVRSFTLPSSLSSQSSSLIFNKNHHHHNNQNRHLIFMGNDPNDQSNDDSTISATTTTSAAPISDAERLREQAKRVKLEAQKMEAELTLEKIEKLEKTVKSLSSSNDKDDEKKLEKKRKDIKIKIQNLAKNLDPNLLSTLPISIVQIDEAENNDLALQTVETNLYKSKDDAAASATSTSATTNIETNLYKNRTFSKPKPTINESDLLAAVDYFNSLPKQMRKTLANAIDLDDEFTNPSIIVLGLYEFMGTDSVSPTRLSRLYNNIQEQSSTQKNLKGGDRTTMDEALSMLEQNKNKGIGSIFGNSIQNTDDNVRLETMIESFLPRVTRKEGMEPTLADVNMLKLCKILGKETFQMSAAPQSIPGGFILRGEMVPKLRGDCDELIRRIDEMIENSDSMPNDWNEKFQVNIMTDPTPQLFEDEESFDGETVLVVHTRDLRPTTNQFILSGVTTLSLFLTFIFSIAVFSQNEVVMERLTSANAIGDLDLAWFNQLISPLLISLGLTQAFHEAGHLFIAKKDNFKITPPTVLPLVALPYLSLKQSIKTSPKNFDSLFNFGAIGPAIGMVVSTAFFLTGLQLTLTMDANALEYAPSVPVLFIKFSTLGGTIVDNVIGGGQGIITQQDPLTPVKLHPFAIGGLASLMINCLDTIPLPGTDGGRMSQALLGRSGQVAFGGVVYFSLLAYTFFSGHRDIFLAFLLINSFARQDNEVPCRNEIDRASLGQAALALVMWSIAILTLTPLE